jgi:hypothetical protein
MWYEAVIEAAKRLGHLSKYWAFLPWDGREEWTRQLQNDNVLRHVEADQLIGNAERIQNGLNDLVILLLFSVFEANVRELVEQQLKLEVEYLRHPTLVKAGNDALDAVSEGSFFRVLEPYKATAHHDLLEQINQIRRYRNWVAHGRRSDRKPEAAVTPREAYDRLNRFLEVIRGPSPTADQPVEPNPSPISPVPPPRRSE